MAQARRQQTSANARDADLLGDGGGSATAGVLPTLGRPTTPDGLIYMDTGEPTPLFYRRQQDVAGLISPDQYNDTTFRPKYVSGQNRVQDTAAQGGDEYKFDPKKGLYYTEVPQGYAGSQDGRLYITNEGPGTYDAATRAPTFSVAELPKNPGQGNYLQTVQGGALGAAAGGRVGGVPGAVVGAGLGAAASLPGAQGRGLVLSAGDPSQMPAGQRIGTPSEAAQANLNYANTGSSLPPGGGNNYGAPGGGQYSTGVPNVALYTPTAGTNGSSALSDEARRVVEQAGQMAQASQTRANTFYDQAATAGQRAAPQMAMPSSANQQAVYDRAMGFQAQSGADAIRAERADISGAGRLENMQMDMQGVNNLESFQNTNSQQGVNALYGFRPDETFRSASELAAWTANNTAEGANAVAGFRPEMVQQDANDLRNFQADRSGIDRLNAYADEAQGPSAAQAMLRSQADADKRAMLAVSRSGRGAGGQVQAQRQAMAEGGLIQAETRGQGAALAAQETEAYKQRQLQALAQAGSLISTAEAQRLQAMSNAGALMSAADQQKLQAVMAYGQLKATQDAQQLSAKQSSGALNANAEGMLLNATSNAAQLQGDMDSRSLSAIGQAAGLRTQQDSIRSNNLQAAGQIRLAGSEINQRGAIAASAADLQAQALNLQSLSLAGQVSSDIRNQDIQVLRSNLDASLQTLGLNDQQVRFFNQLGSDREVASQNLQMQASALGINAEQAQQALNLQWQQFGLSALTQQQQMQYNYAALGQNQSQFDTSAAQNAQQIAMQGNAQQFNQQQTNRQNTLQLAGSALTAFSSLFPTSQSGTSPAAAIGAGINVGLQPQQQATQPSGYNAMGMVFDPFTNQWVYPNGAQGGGGNGWGGGGTPPAGGGGTSFGV